MNLKASTRSALSGVASNKLRSMLTTLGILIGVGAVIVLVAVGNGSSKAVQDSIGSLGSNTLTVTSSAGGTGSRGGGGGGFGGPGGGFGGGTSSVSTGTQTRVAALTLDDAAALVSSTSPDVAAEAPVVSVSSTTATYDGATHSVSNTIGTTAAYLSIEDLTVSTGRTLTDADDTSRRRVALIGVTTAEDLVGGDGTQAVGKVIQLNGTQFTVVGLLTAKGSTGATDQDDRIIAPLTAVQDTLAGYGSISSIEAQATSTSTVTAAEDEITAILLARHKVTTADFTVSSASSIIAAATSSNQTFTVLLAAVAALSLLVGGIGVMNIMLVTVTERTREIGIRKAIGARRGDIISQFLVEAVLLSVLGGLAGIGAGLLGSNFTIVGVKPVVEWSSVGLAFGVAVLTGLFFGLYPASRAASLRPIDALRYE